MSADASLSDFKKYLSKNNIFILDKFDDQEQLEQNIEEQMEIISEFHLKAMGYRFNLSKIIENNTGKLLEQYKVDIKKLKRDLRNTKEAIILEEGQRYIDRAEKCIKSISASDYIELIKRSMERNEICIGNTYWNNIRKKDTIQIVSLKGCNYNLVEVDGVNLFSKLKRKGTDYDWNSLIQKFCDDEKLDVRSYTFILALVSYPCEFMRCWRRYCLDKKEWSKEEFIKKIKRAIIKDGDSLI